MRGPGGETGSPPGRARHHGESSDGQDDNEIVWGVLVALHAPSRENGLLSNAQACHCDGLSTAMRMRCLPGHAWLWRSTPPQLRPRHFPTPCQTAPPSSLCGVTTSATKRKTDGSGERPASCLSDGCEGLGASASAAVMQLPPHLLLPLCSPLSNQGAVKLGRRAGNDIVFASNPCISSLHCVIAIQSGLTGGTANGGIGGDSNAAMQPATHETSIPVEKVVARHLREIVAPSPVTCPTPMHTEGEGNEAARAAVNADVNEQPTHYAVATGGGVVHVILRDYSTNGCTVKGASVGKGNFAYLQDGDVVQFVHAGPRHTPDHNVGFRFFTAGGFIKWMTEQQQQQQADARIAGTVVVPSESLHAAEVERAVVRRQLSATHRLQGAAVQRHARLCKAQWDVEAQVRRIYRHAVDEFYCLDRAQPLGKGAFGTVFRARLRTDTASISSSPEGLGQDGNPSVSRWDWKRFCSSARTQPWPSTASEEAQLKESYIRYREYQAPATVSCLSVAAEATVAPPQTSVEKTDFIFAVKVIHKQRMLLDVLQAVPTNEVLTATAGNSATAPALIYPPLAEAAVLQQLVLLETQPDDLAAQRREEWIAGALARLPLADTAVSSAPFDFQSGEKHGGLDLFADGYAGEGGGSLAAPIRANAETTTDRGIGVEHRKRQREQQRRELLRCLPEPLRRAYEKELLHRRRQQCEINILFSVRHPNMTRLYEVFDQPQHLALVMEQATGGEVWDLLQPYARRRRQASLGKTGGDGEDRSVPAERVARGPTFTAMATAASPQDPDLVSVGGPLPEFMVKMIMVQVLEAVLHLHSLGIIHRDLKLENVLLHRPCDRYALSALQLELLVHQLHGYRGAWQDGAKGGSDAVAAAASLPHAEAAEAEVELANPLSVLHTVHLPRHMWPVVKVTDFGLSRVLDHLQPRPVELSSRCPEEDVEGEAPARAADRARLIYARNDATTSCGTAIYAAPEITHPSLRPDKVGYSAVVDMYSIGVMTYALLTGRAPFPSKPHPRRLGGPPVVDYDAPLRFERYRHRKAVPNKADAPHSGPQPFGEQACTPSPHDVRLPSLSLVESVRVLMPDKGALPPASPTLPLTTSRQTRQWNRHVSAVAAMLRRAEQQRNEETGEVPTGRDCGGSTFERTVEQLCTSLTTFAERCRSEGREVDLDRLVYTSSSAMGADVAGGVAAPGRVVGSDGHAVEVELPPISALGASFLRGLLEKYPARRMTAFEALRHPWLRECT